MTKVYYSWQDITNASQSISNKMYQDKWFPDYIVGITRGGLPLATILSNQLKIQMHTLDVSLRDNYTCESNCWMSEDAFGSDDNDMIQKNILIVDDINDTGATLNWIMEDWKSTCLPDNDKWNNIWNQNVRFAVIVDNLSSSFNKKIDYCWTEINKAENNDWIVFPWEE